MCVYNIYSLCNILYKYYCLHSYYQPKIKNTINTKYFYLIHSFLFNTENNMHSYVLFITKVIFLDNIFFICGGTAVLHFVFGISACFNQFCTTSVNDTSSSGVIMYPDNVSKIFIYL
jgi:hypothetical protein